MSNETKTPAQKPPIVVLGAGVIGLTTALRVQEQGKYDVAVVAETLPTDPLTIRYTSHWAGAHHVYSGRDPTTFQHKLEVDTFKKLWELSAHGTDTEKYFLRIDEAEYFHDEDGAATTPLKDMPNFRVLPKEELLAGAKSGVKFSTVTIDTPVYLNHLLERFIALGGKVIRGSLLHINQMIEGGAKIFEGGHSAMGNVANAPVAVINCTGIGARLLGGVEDSKVYPVRGQTCILNAPWMRFGRTLYVDDTGAFTYIIPRRSGDVIVGGTRGKHDWHGLARPETTTDILTRGLALCPELASPEVRAQREPTVDDLRALLVGEGCGLRPYREGGIRIETEWTEGVGGRGKVPIVHNYGHGGAGYQVSWASANIALKLLEDALVQL
ncbi:D-amino-acid oxidase [Coprinellus micaceus]|uniref:D-amino-acid oxidase n=1 Tax=Coprinellus micaceus TaxID=71717 RepID=A0A4Y7T710_COPMI|nr:D-amino-acid oxidase [Coprinellus micaceus]